LRRLAASWRSLEPQLRQSEQIDAAPGFTRRWKARVQAQRERRRRRQVSLVLAGTLAGAFLSLMALGLAALMSPAGLAAGWIESVIRARQVLEASLHLVTAIGDGLPAIIGGIAVSLTLAWLSVLWFASIYRFAFQNLPNGGR
jgi:4-hydroxybenzoate polyprenyltransferase